MLDQIGKYRISVLKQVLNWCKAMNTCGISAN